MYDEFSFLNKGHTLTNVVHLGISLESKQETQGKIDCFARSFFSRKDDNYVADQIPYAVERVEIIRKMTGLAKRID